MQSLQTSGLWPMGHWGQPCHFFSRQGLIGLWPQAPNWSPGWGSRCVWGSMLLPGGLWEASWVFQEEMVLTLPGGVRGTIRNSGTGSSARGPFRIREPQCAACGGQLVERSFGSIQYWPSSLGGPNRSPSYFRPPVYEWVLTATSTPPSTSLVQALVTLMYPPQWL
jgi:hypothetical protein